MPNDTAAIEAVLAVMPNRVAGLARVDARPNMADYEGDALVAVTPLGEPTQSLSAMNVLAYLRLLSKGAAPGEIEKEQLDPSAQLVYLIFNTVGNGRRVYLMSWGSPDSVFMFGAKAQSPEARKALVQAFVEAAGN